MGERQTMIDPHNSATWPVGIPVIVGGRQFAICKDCRQVIRLDKPLIGSMHFCAEDK